MRSGLLSRTLRLALFGGGAVLLVAAAGTPMPLPPRFNGFAGLSGKIKVVLADAADVPDLKAAGFAVNEPGVYPVRAVARPPDDLALVLLTPFGSKVDGRIGEYVLGNWPEEGGRKTPPSYGCPRGFIKVTKEEMKRPLSDHFVLGDFLTHGQPSVWPKYEVVDPRLVDKLELTIAQLEASGHPVKHMHVMSGFRTPAYNAQDVGPGARSAISRHMYGDAADVYPDDDGNDLLDDLNHDGRVDMEDAKILARAASAVEKTYPVLAGGIGLYPATKEHGPFVHIDARGKRARWGGTFE